MIIVKRNKVTFDYEYYADSTNLSDIMDKNHLKFSVFQENATVFDLKNIIEMCIFLEQNDSKNDYFVY